MSEVKKVARAEIEFDGEGLEDGRIEFELEGQKWSAWPTERTYIQRVRNCVDAIKQVKEELDCGLDDALNVVRTAVFEK